MRPLPSASAMRASATCRFEGRRKRERGVPQSKDRREGRLPVLAAVSTVKLSGMLTA